MKIRRTTEIASSGVKLLVYGQAGAGKTTLIRTLPTPLVLSAEGGLLSIQDADLPFVEITDIGTLRETYSWLSGFVQYFHPQIQ